MQITGFVFLCSIEVNFKHSGSGIQKCPSGRDGFNRLPKAMRNVNDCGCRVKFEYRIGAATCTCCTGPINLPLCFPGMDTSGRAARVSAPPSNGSSFLLEVSRSESASVGALARHQDTMFLIVPSKKMLGNMKQSGEAPALKEAPTERAALLSHWRKCNTMKPFIYQWKRSQ